MTDSHDRDADLQLDCQTCLAANTTACNDCLVTHLLANDAGPIEFVTTGIEPVTRRADTPSEHGAEPESVRARSGPDAAVGAAVELLAKAGLVDDPPTWVDRSEFERGVLSTVS